MTHVTLARPVRHETTGMLGLLIIAVLFSTNRRAISPRVVLAALALLQPRRQAGA